MEFPRQEAQASSSHKSCDHGDGLAGGDRGGFDRSIELMSVDQRDSSLVGAPIVASGGFGGGFGVAAVEVKTAEKRKRGRPPRGGHVKAMATPPPPAAAATTDEEEDVCFICFDGGSLVLCDRRNCPKAYHPACIKRDEAFFRSRAKWNCGWHICSACMKASYYLCYTCTYSLCKGCTKDADFVCVRGNKGFCGTCKRTILLIENFEGNKEAPQVDFDDKSSWEYLFKVYWVLLKGNLSLTLDELLEAKNPWKPPPDSASKWGLSGGLYGGNYANSCPEPEVFNAKRRKVNTKTNVLMTGNSLGIEEHSEDTITHLHKDTNWASKELLEFVAHMRNGDTSFMSLFDVQDLLLEYIKQNNLRDPNQKCQIVCDSRFFNMFGQARLGHIEMLKLLESHFLVKDDCPVKNTIMSGLTDAVGSRMESGWNYESQMMTVNDKSRKVSKRVDEKGMQMQMQTNTDAYARIDVNNIKLIYLRRCLLENLLDDVEKFHEKVVGSIVRIRISNSDQKPDMHRLVRVVGTTKDSVSYRIGTRETNVLLEILNLDKKEVMALDRISNQEFSQEECERLRQSIKYGLIKRLTVAEIQEKAIALQEVKVNDWLGAEVLRLNHLRDLANEKGRRKELRECVEKLQQLNSPEERKRMLEEVPVVHSDPTMDPSYDFDHCSGELDQKKQENKAKTRNSGVGRKKREPISPGGEGDILTNCGSHGKSRITRAGRNKDKTLGLNGLNTLKNEVDSPDSGTNQSASDWEMRKIWHYQDPTGKIQGPFFMLQLRKWSISGHFPPHLRIWRLNEKPEDSILLTDALEGLCSNEQLLPINTSLPLPEQENNVAPDDNRINNVNNSSQSKSADMDSESVKQSKDLELNGPIGNVDGSNEAVGSDAAGSGSNPSSSTTVAVPNSSDGNSMLFSEGLDSLNGNDVLPTQPQVSGSLSAPVSPASHQISEDRATERNSDRSANADSETGDDPGRENRSDGEGQSSQSSGQNWRPPVSSPTNNQDSNSQAKSLETSEPNPAVPDFPTPPNTTPKPRNECPEVEAASLGVVPIQDTGLSWSTASSLVGGGGAPLPEVGGESGGYSAGPAKPSSAEEWDSSLISAPSLKQREISGDHVTTPASISDHLTPSSPSSWHDMIPDPDEFSSLLDESVSDLLAEVEAMETLHALSCYSAGNMTHGSKTDCISPVEGFSPAPEPGKNDAFSSTADINLPPQSGAVDEPVTADALKDETISISPEADGDAKNSEVSVNQWEASAEIQSAVPPPPLPPPPPPPAAAPSWSVEITDAARPESMSTDWGGVQGTTSMSWESQVMDWSRSTTPRQNNNNNVSSAAPVPAPLQIGGILGSQPRLGGDRYSPRDRDRAHHGSRDSGLGRNRHGWNRQPYYGGGSGGGGGAAPPYRAPAKGQRVCKFYESGYCKRGTSCSFLHHP